MNDITKTGIVLILGDNQRDGGKHVEWHAPCTCAFHPWPSPHWHPCPQHKAAGRATDLAFELADETAMSDIECNCLAAEGEGLPQPADPKRWYDTRCPDDQDDQAIVDRAIEYLDLRKLLELHPEQPHLVRFRRTS